MTGWRKMQAAQNATVHIARPLEGIEPAALQSSTEIDLQFLKSNKFSVQS